jgi:hypothetical protein
VITPQSYSDINGQCPGQRCTWERYTSLGIFADVFPTVEAIFNCHDNSSSSGCRLDGDFIGNSSGYKDDKRALTEIARWIYVDDLEFIFMDPPRFDAPILPRNDTVYGYAATTLSQEKESLHLRITKVMFALCLHTYRTVTENGQTTTTLLQQGPVLTSDPLWRWTPDIGLPKFQKCGEADGVSACLSDYIDITYGDPGLRSISARRALQLLLEGLGSESTGHDKAENQFSEEIRSAHSSKDPESLLKMMQNVARGVTNRYVNLPR